jgi:hypothetical protein
VRAHARHSSSVAPACGACVRRCDAREHSRERPRGMGSHATSCGTSASSPGLRRASGSRPRMSALSGSSAPSSRSRSAESWCGGL